MHISGGFDQKKGTIENYYFIQGIFSCHSAIYIVTFFSYAYFLSYNQLFA